MIPITLNKVYSLNQIWYDVFKSLFCGSIRYMYTVISNLSNSKYQMLKRNLECWYSSDNVFLSKISFIMIILATWIVPNVLK